MAADGSGRRRRWPALFPSLRARLTLLACLAVAAALLLGSLVVLSVLEHTLVENLDDAALGRARDVASELEAGVLVDPLPVHGDEDAFVAIDTLVARTDRSFSTWRLTLSLFREQGLPDTVTPSVRLIGAMASVLPTKVKKKQPASPLGGAEGTVLDVPAYSQEVHLGEYPEYNGGGEAWNKVKSLAKKITPVALAVSFIEGVIDGVKSELPESAEN